ncbi:hypothetical protein A0J61_03374, partial [Choanephora cucurbitarum]
ELEDSVIVYGTTWIAWLQILSVMLINSAASLMWMSASSTPTVTAEWLHISLTQLNWLSNISAIINTCCSLITGWSYQRFGMKSNIVFAAVINLIGCWVRCLSIMTPVKYRYPMVMLGQAIASFGGAFIYNISAKIASLWFAPKDRGIANTLTALSLGMALAPILIPYVAPTVDKIPTMWLMIAIISTVAAIPSFFLPAAPPIPASPSADKDRMGVREGYRQLMKSNDFWLCAILCGTNTGMVFSVSLLVMEAISPLGYTDQQAGYCAASVVMAGYVGGLFAGYFMGATGQHIMLIKLLTPCMVFTYVMFIFEIIPNAFPVILINCSLNGFFAYALFPVCLEFVCEISYPVPESIASSLLWAFSTGLMLIFSVLIDSLRAGPDADPPNNMKLSMIVVAIIVALGSLPAIWLQGQLKRLAVDQQKT